MKCFSRLMLLAAIPAFISCGNVGNDRVAEVTEVDTAAVVYDNMMTRRSIRKYKSQPVERSKMDSIVLCGVNAPNGMNRQAYEVRIVDSKDYIDGLTKVYVEKHPDMLKDENFKNMFRNAPTVVFIASDTSYDMSSIDCGLLGANMVLSAWSMGVGSCCLGSPVRFMLEDPDARPYLDKLNFSEGYKLLYAIGFGYPDETPQAKPRRLDVVQYVD